MPVLYNSNNFSPRLRRPHRKNNTTKPFLPPSSRDAVLARIGVVEKEVHLGSFPSSAHIDRHITFDELGDVVIKRELVIDGSVTEL